MSPEARIVGIGLGVAVAVAVTGWLLRPDDVAEAADAPSSPVRERPVPVDGEDEGPAVAVVEPEPVVPAADGEAVFMQHCATCHMADGKGVPNFQPPIVGSPVLDEGALRIETVIRAGSAALKNRPNPMGWEMPPFGYLTDPEIKALVAYLQQRFGESG